MTHSYTREENKRVFLSKDMTTDQTFRNLSFRFNSLNLAFSGSNGLGYDDASSSFFIIHAAGFADQRITADIKFSTATTAGSEDLGVVARFQTLESSDDTYYYARIYQGAAYLYRVVDGSFGFLDGGDAFALTQDQWATVTLTCQGSSISATFEADGGSPATVNLSATDSNVPEKGIMGVLSIGSSLFCRNFTVEQL